MSIRNRTINSYFIALGVIILLEVFVCNYLFFRNIGNEAIPYYLQGEEDKDIRLNGLDVLPDGRIEAADNDDRYIEIDNLNIDGRDLYIGLSDMEWIGDKDSRSVDFLIEIIDDSHNDYYIRGGVKTVNADIEQTKYINLRPMGNLKAIRIHLLNIKYTDILQIDSIVVNCKRPLFFSVPRVILFFVLFLLVYHLRKGSRIYDICYDGKSKRQTVVAYVVLLLMIFICLHLSGYLTEENDSYTANPYKFLAHSMANGHVDLELDMPVSEELLAVEDPYVPGNRTNGTYYWDCAYYEGKYYVYYGVVPEILFYLPYYLRTGKDLGITEVGQIELVLFIIGIFMCFRELGKMFSGKIPFVTWLLLLIASTCGMQVILLSRMILLYHIPVIMGAALVVWGFYFWITSSRGSCRYSTQRDRRCSQVRITSSRSGCRYSTLKIAAGSLCMALAVGCRPQLIFGSLLAVPIFIKYFLEKREEKRSLNCTVKYLTAGAVPYIVVLGLLFYYNAIRFGSPFEFGARYNLTAIDVTRVGADFGKFIPGLFWYLFVPPKITTTFPFVENLNFASSYTGDIFAHQSNGGFMICNPLTFFIFIGLKNRNLFENRFQKGVFLTSILVSAVILGINWMLGGFMPRYYSDFAPFMHIACVLVICLMIAKSDERDKKVLLPMLSYFCVVTVFYHYLTYYLDNVIYPFSKYDREVFQRALLLWQWWE